MPESRPDTANSVVVAQIAGPPDIDPLVVQQKGGEPVVLDYLAASTHGRLLPAKAPAASWVSSPTISVIVRGIETGLAVGLYWAGR